MQLNLLKAKIHRATVTHCELHYDGSVAIDGTLLAAAGIHEFEQVHVWNVTNGARLTTYAIRAAAASGIVSLNGSAARYACVGDLVILAAFAQLSEADASTHRPKLIYVNSQNALTHTQDHIPIQHPTV